jgi:hemolysin activation/secretion protein
MRLSRKLPLSLFLAVSPLLAEAANPTIPDAGAILQQVRPVEPNRPSPADTGLRIDAPEKASLPVGEAFLVNSIRIVGNTLIDTATLHALIADAEGQLHTFSQLAERAAILTACYQSHGYPLARAIIPAQTIRDGVVQFDIVEAHYGKIELDNRSTVRDSLLQATLEPLHSGQPVEQAAMNRALLLLGDIRGMTSTALLRPGAAVGSSDLLVKAEAGPAVSGNIGLDNYGTDYTGVARLSATLNAYNLLHHGDVLSGSLISAGRGLNNGRIAYDALINGQGTYLGGAFSQLYYRLGDNLADLDGYGSAQIASLWARHTLVRSQDANLYGQIGVDKTRLSDHVGAVAIQNDRHVQDWSASLSGDGRDGLLSGGMSGGALSWTSGKLDFDTTAAELADQATAKTAGTFSKWSASVSRLQNLGGTNSLFLNINGQQAAGNLDASMKMSVGGPYSVRAYAAGALSADSGYQASLEWRHDLAPAWQSQWQTVVFADYARLTINQSPWSTGDNAATLSGAGLGVNWAGPNGFSGRLYVAARLGSKEDLVGDNSNTRAWGELRWGF